MKLGRIGILALVPALTSCPNYDFEHDEPVIHVSAAFSAVPLGGAAPLVVQFTDESEGDLGGWDWSFGDGEVVPGTSPSASITHTYETPGTYTVTLHVISCTSAVHCEHAWETKTGLITVTAAPAASSATSGMPREIPRASLRASGDPGARMGASIGPIKPVRADPTACSLFPPSRSTLTGRVLIELIASCASDGPLHVCPLEGLRLSALAGKSLHSMRRVRPSLGTAAREAGCCAASVRFLLALPRDAWPLEALFAVDVAAGRAPPRRPRRERASELRKVPAGVALELIATFD